MFKQSNRGFTLIDVLVGAAIFLIFAVGIYSGTILVFKIVKQAKIQVVATGLLNNEIETIHNVPWANVGVQGVDDGGALLSSKIINRGDIDFIITTHVSWVDDAVDSTLSDTPPDTDPQDYKLVEVSLTCSQCGLRGAVAMSTIVAN